ncbi:ABC transporter ATP-binding protein/permease [Pelistega europaea]|uniref:ABC transporter ATP-binding protein/permease n=1 Tax=Pelistega europaea TaxID=106147 RepID=A0A7Y4P6F2_9BURK|nr:ABC transporter ATP-binding protein/permease [Pelistega europaea]NOL49695.1 ABC transporter ATP-binding protein/permease [Pelistega europaea]
MNWSQELMDSAWWIGRAFLISSVFLVVTGFILIKTTRWASQFWSLAGHYFNPKKKPLTIVTFVIILLLSLAGVRINVLFSNWYNTMYTALQKLDANAFWIQMGVFAVLATIHVSRILLAYYLQQRFEIKWRETMNEEMLSRWLDKKSYYRSYYLKSPIDNPDQRIQQDVIQFAQLSLELTLGVISSLVSAVAFTLILWNLSGDLPIFGVVIPRGMVFMLFIYVLITTFLAFRIGRPLIQLNFLNERLNANYRYSLIRVREYAESIAFYAGEKIESNRLTRRFKEVIENMWGIVHRSLKFQGFNLIVSQTALVFPFIIQAPRFFAGKLELGGMVQTAQAFSNLLDNLSFFRTAYDSFAQYRAVLDRLTGFHHNIDEADNLPLPNVRANGGELSLNKVSISTPAGRELVKEVSFRLNAGDALLIQGPSGSGKTTLLRTIAGLWPYSQGEVVRPDKEVLFLSQKPYLPEGRLIDALYYPDVPPPDALEQAKHVMDKVHLAHLAGRLSEVLNWTHMLSVGEQQRVAFARILLTKPKVVFMDEATAAMDEGLEFAMYKLLRETYPSMRIVSVGHRSTLLVHHTHVLQIHPEGGWTLQETPHQG